MEVMVRNLRLFSDNYIARATALKRVTVLLFVAMIVCLIGAVYNLAMLGQELR